MNIRRIQPLIALVALALLANAALAADTIKKIVSPADFENKEGEGASTIFIGGPGTDKHFQQFYLADDFLTSLPTGGYIKESVSARIATEAVLWPGSLPMWRFPCPTPRGLVLFPRLLTRTREPNTCRFTREV